MTSASFIAMGISTAPQIQYKRTSKYDKYREEYIRIGKQFDVTRDFEEKARSVKFNEGKLGDKISGECNYFFNEITINSTHWNLIGQTAKEELIFHELQHCVIPEFGHRKKGIMKAEGFYPSITYKLNYQMLINDLFKCKKKTLDCVKIYYDDKKYLDK